MSLRNQIRKYIKEKVNVYIDKTDEAWCQGDYRYAVVVDLDVNPKGFWLNAFKKKETAIKYCNKLGLKIVEG